MSEAKPRVVVFTTTWCRFCGSAKNLLERRGIAYEEIDAERLWGEAFREELFRISGRLTVPQILVDGKAIGGYSDLVELDESGGLRQLSADGVTGSDPSRPAP